MEQEIYQLGAVAIIFIFAVKEFFTYLKTRRNGGSNGLLKELRSTNTNHLQTIDKTLNEGFDKVVKTITDMHLDLANRLSEMKGRLK